MSVFKCKMCGGDLVVEEGKSVCECECCGSKQTLPKFDDEKKIVLFTRANELRSKCEFDKAAEVYEKIVSEFPEEAEAYWGLILCRYGIEYVDDPQSGRKIPTCHRSSYDIVLDEPDFEMVMEYSDTFSKAVYREQAKEIERLRSKIMEVSSKEKPYDIFICYKEKDENGERTVDSVIAQNVYDALTVKGYRVFFSRISLEDKLGREYEPYIFAALHSAKIMLVFGTKYDYINSVWVKNEWSRFLALIKGGAEKFIIPCYKDIDAYDIPKEIRSFQAQDMGKVGAVQDLVRGIEKIIEKSGANNSQNKVPAVEKQTVQKTPDDSNDMNINELLRWTRIFVEAGDWSKAHDYCEKIINKNPEIGEVYLLKDLTENQCSDLQNLAKTYCDKDIWEYSKNLKLAKIFGGEQILKELEDFDNFMQKYRIEKAWGLLCNVGVVREKIKASDYNAYVSRNWTQFHAYCNKLVELYPENGEVYLLKELAMTQSINIEKLALVYCWGGMKSYSKNLEFAKKFGGSSVAEKLAEFDEKLKRKRKFKKLILLILLFSCIVALGGALLYNFRYELNMSYELRDIAGVAGGIAGAIAGVLGITAFGLWIMGDSVQKIKNM